MWIKQIGGLARYLAFDAAIAISVGLLWDAQTAFLFLAALYVARIGLMLYNVARQLVAYFIFGGKRALKRHFMDVLAAGSFPKEREIWHGASEYIAEVQQNKKLPVSTRCAAAEVGGYFEGQKLVAPLSSVLQLHALGQAVTDYAIVTPVGLDDPEFEEEDDA